MTRRNRRDGKRVATLTAFVPVGFPLDDEPTVNSHDELAVATSGHTTSGAVRTVVSALVTGAPAGMRSLKPPNLARGCHRMRVARVSHERQGEETITLRNRRERARQITPCTSLAPDFPISPGKMRPSFYPTAW